MTRSDSWRLIGWTVTSGLLVVGGVLGFLTAPALTSVAVASVVGFALLLTAPAERVLSLVISVVFAAMIVIRVIAPSGAIQIVVMLALAACLAIAYFRTPDRKRADSPVVWLYALIGMVSAAATLAAQTPDWFYGGIFVLSATVMAVGTSLSAQARRSVERVIVVTGVVLAVVSILETFVFNDLIWFELRQGQSAHAFIAGAVRAEATIGHPIVLGFVLLSSMLLILTTTRLSSLMVLALSVLGLGIVATGSASVAAVGVLAVALSLWTRWSASSRSLAFVGGAIVLLLSGGVIWETISAELSEVNAGHRLASVSAVPQLLLNQPIPIAVFGNGWGSNETVFANGLIRQSLSTAIDNQWITTLAQSGLIGVLLLLGFVVVSVARTRRRSMPLVLSGVAMFFSFDIFLWALPSFILALALSEIRSSESVV
jgi:hypothetical protein